MGAPARIEYQPFFVIGYWCPFPMKIYFKYTRKATVTETGVVAVEAGEAASYKDVYRKAFKKDFVEFLPTDREFDKEEWDFEMIKNDKKTA